MNPARTTQRELCKKKRSAAKKGNSEGDGGFAERTREPKTKLFLKAGAPSRQGSRGKNNLTDRGRPHQNRRQVEVKPISKHQKKTGRRKRERGFSSITGQDVKESPVHAVIAVEEAGRKNGGPKLPAGTRGGVLSEVIHRQSCQILEIALEQGAFI